MNEKKNEAAPTGFSKLDTRLDGLLNVLNRYGTSKDSSEAYEYVPEDGIADAELAARYEGDGLFAKIIDIPAEKAATGDYDLGLSDKNVESLVTDALEDLKWTTTAAQAVKWSRLFGGAIAVMLIDDGGRLEDPVNWEEVRGIDELVLFERAVVEPDYYSMYSYGLAGLDRARTKFGWPQFFTVYSRFGCFTAHESRCLIFRNGIVPEVSARAEYQFWGIPEFIRIKRSLRETITNHTNATRLLERSVQGVYKMEGLTAMLAGEGGEDKVLKRLNVIDMARGITNSIVIDREGEDYGFQTFQLSGIKDTIDVSCNMLSAVTNIPQTVLFGSSPAGMNATGESDLENWYNYLSQIQQLQLKDNLQRLLDVLFRGWLNTQKLQEEPKYKLTFKPLWNLSEQEQADLAQKNTNTQQIKAQVSQMYVDMGALDPSEVRRGLAKSEDFNVEELLDDEDLGEDDFSDLGSALSELMAHAENHPPESTEETDADDQGGSVGVIVVKDGKILCGNRHHGQKLDKICGPGGHIEDGETPEKAAFRETEEEFGISPKNLIPIGRGPKEADTGLMPHIFLCTEYEGEPECLDQEMGAPRFRTLAQLEYLEPSLFEPFRDSLAVLFEFISEKSIDIDGEDDSIEIEHSFDGGPGSGNFNHAGVPGKVGGSAPSASARGENPPCKGFDDKKQLTRHATKHSKMYPGMSEKDYEKHATEFLTQPCSDTVDGYITAYGEIVRFDRKTGEYAKGVPGGRLVTCYIAKFNEKTGNANLDNANKYFDRLKKSEGVEDNDEGNAGEEA